MRVFLASAVLLLCASCSLFVSADPETVPVIDDDDDDDDNGEGEGDFGEGEGEGEGDVGEGEGEGEGDVGEGEGEGEGEPPCASDCVNSPCVERTCQAGTCIVRELTSACVLPGGLTGVCANGTCSCDDDRDCDDLLFCTGDERCNNGSCTSLLNTCPLGCDESNDSCDECNVDSDCPVASGVCDVRTCVNGSCGVKNVAAGTSCSVMNIGGNCDANGQCCQQVGASNFCIPGCSSDVDCGALQTCDTNRGVCTCAVGVNAACDDGNACTIDEVRFDLTPLGCSCTHDSCTANDPPPGCDRCMSENGSGG
jgi:hypothetical protein